MAKETKSISVHPDNEQSTIDLYQTFGWELQSSQEIFNKDSHLERDGDNINSVTTTTNYVKLVFARNTEMKNYRQLADLENRYNKIHTPIRKSAKVWFILGLVAGALGACNASTLLFSIPCFIGCAALFVLGFIKMKKHSDEYYSESVKAQKERTGILQEAANLL